jgi:hypothetical protein
MRRRSIAVLLSAIMLAGIGWFGRAPYTAEAVEDGTLRLSWRLRGEKLENCRPRTQAELDALPVHMRTPEICEGRLLTYRLVLQLDDEAPDTVEARPQGAKGDRPVYVLQQRRLTPGAHRVRVRFEALGGSSAPLLLDTVIHASAGAIELVTLDDAGRFVHHSGSPD